VRDFQDAFQTLQQKMKVEEDKASKPVVELIVKTIEEFGKKNNYSIIMDMRGAGVMYNAPAANLTDSILVEVNKAGRAKK
jgi:outer membrane protein